MAAADPFDLVRQFDAMRQQVGAPPTSVQSYMPPPPPSPSVSTAPQGLQGPAAPSAPAPLGGTVAKGTGQGTVPWGGKKISAALVPYAEALAKQGLRFTSGYRDPDYNKRVGGVKNSLHTRQGETGALDFAGTAKQMQQGAAWAKANGAREVLVHNVGSGQHLHVAW